MVNEVVPFPGNTILPEAPNSILEKAKTWGLERCLVIGWDDNGEFIHGGSHCDIAGNILLLELAKKRQLDEAYGD